MATSTELVESVLSSPPASLDSVARVHVVLLKVAGLVAFDGHSFSFPPTILFSLYNHWSHLLCTTMYFSGMMRSFLSSDLEYDVELIAECVGVIGVHARFLILFASRAKIASVLAECRRLWVEELNDSEKTIIKSFVDKSCRITHIYLAANGVQMFFYITVSQLATAPVGNVSGSIRNLPYPYYADVQATPWYELSFATQLVGMFGICVSCSGADTAAPFFIMVACGQLRSLCSRLQNLERLDAAVESPDIKLNTGKKIVECIIYHQRIIALCKEVEKLTNALFMVQVLSTTYNMSLIGLQLLGNDPHRFRYLTILSLLMMQLFMCQWAPDVLVSESESLAKSAYFVPSSGNYDKKLSKLIHIMMIRSQRSVQLTAGGYVNLSMECFGSMITSAVSFFTVLRSMN